MKFIIFDVRDRALPPQGEGTQGRLVGLKDIYQNQTPILPSHATSNVACQWVQNISQTVLLMPLPPLLEGHPEEVSTYVSRWQHLLRPAVFSINLFSV